MIDLRHQPNEPLDRLPDSTSNRRRGSIMIWTVMLGLLLTSVFFFFSMRQRMMLGVQRETADKQDAKLLLESYADYFENRCKAGGCLSDPVTVDFPSDGISGSVTKKVGSIENSVDLGEIQSYTSGGTISVFVEWNRCLKATTPDSSGDLKVNGVVYPHEKTVVCSASEEFDDIVGPISVTDPMRIETLNIPFSFRVKSTAGGVIADNRWHLELVKDLGYGKSIVIRRTFE